VNRAYGTSWRLVAGERRRPHLNESAEAARATSAVHNRAAACVAAGGDIFENQL